MEGYRPNYRQYTTKWVKDMDRNSQTQLLRDIRDTLKSIHKWMWFISVGVWAIVFSVA